MRELCWVGHGDERQYQAGEAIRSAPAYVEMILSASMPTGASAAGVVGVQKSGGVASVYR